MSRLFVGGSGDSGVAVFILGRVLGGEKKSEMFMRLVKVGLRFSVVCLCVRLVRFRCTLRQVLRLGIFGVDFLVRLLVRCGIIFGFGFVLGGQGSLRH